MSDSVLRWATDGDASYLGARACQLNGLTGPFHTLAHAAIERYLKGILQGADPARFSIDALRKEFRHNLSKLLDAAKGFHPMLQDPKIRERCEALRQEFDAARYFVTADVEAIIGGHHLECLGALDEPGAFDDLICVIRNELVIHLGVGERQQTLLSTARRGRRQRWRELLEKDNRALPRFVGLDQPPPF